MYFHTKVKYYINMNKLKIRFMLLILIYIKSKAESQMYKEQIHKLQQDLINELKSE